MERDTELALFEQLRQGDSNAFDDVYAAFNTRLFTFLLRLSLLLFFSSLSLSLTSLPLFSLSLLLPHQVARGCSPSRSTCT